MSLYQSLDIEDAIMKSGGHESQKLLQYHINENIYMIEERRHLYHKSGTNVCIYIRI